MKNTYLSLITLLLITGCASKSTNPSGVAYNFWLAQKEHKLQDATKLTIKKDLDKTKLHKKVEISDINFETAKITDNDASIPTTLLLKNFSPINQADAKVTFETKMQKHDGEWKINMFETKKALYFAIGDQFTQNIGTDLSATIQQIIGDGDNIKNIFEQLIKGLQKATDIQN